jgi:VWFA-related protein
MQSGRSDGVGRSLPSLVAALILAGAWGVLAQTPPPFQIRVETNVVMARVVVRDAKGRPVAGLRKEDFRLSDSGKPQEITGFAVETGNAGAAAEAPKPAPETAAASATSVPQRFVALYFDDLHMETGAVGQTRDAAWRYISTKLRTDDRVAIFTSSNTSKRGIVDFTDDRVKLHDALFRLAPHSRTNPQTNQCPAIGEYQAYLIAVRQQSDALEIAVEEGYSCHCKGINETGECRNSERVQAQGSADQIWGLADRQSQDALDVMDGVVNLLAARPGQRTLVLVSSGFLTATREKSIDALIDRALRRNVVVNALDAAGLYTKTYHNPILMARPDLDREKFRVENEAVSVQRDVLAALAQGTGGTFFQNSNDFDDGLRQTAQAPEVYYVLSFSPKDVKLDGRFHPLKVTLNTGDGWDVKARRGYYANSTLAEKNPAKTELESMVYSQDERQDLPATVTAQVEKPAGEASTVTVKIHVDIGAVEFRKDGDRSVDTLTFNTAVFDRDGKFVAGKESSLDFRLTDAKLEELAKSGINAQTSFRVAPGTYRIREVVRDTGSKKTSALNCNVEVTAESAAPKKEKEQRPMAEWTAAEFLKAVPELEGLNAAPNQDRLPILLERVGRNVVRLFDALPATTAHEQITLDRLDGIDYGREEFKYLDLPLPAKGGVGRDEFRTNAAGERTEPEALKDGLVTKGFATAILPFHPLYQSESTFRYLGTQSVNGHATDVVYFAQIPGKARVTQSLKTDSRTLQIPIQGLAWIDSGNNQIVRLRTELLEPHDDPDLKMQRTDLRFNAVHLGGVAEAFWLPEQVTVTLKWRGAAFRNRHEYSDFQLLRTEMAPVGPAPGDLPRETVLLAGFKRKIRQVLTQIPNYTCLETVQRSVQKPRASAFSPIDIVLLEVSTVGDKELLAWPGARRFEEGNVSSFASGGMIGSGVFASHARNVFLLETTTMQYHGDEEGSGRMLARFDFRVPEAWSGYQIQANGASAKVGTAGSFWIDPASLELVRMEVRAGDIPAAIGIERTETDIDYAPVRIGDSDILLPQAAKILVALPSGEVRRNDIQFSHCHEYFTESTIRFDMPDTTAARPAQQRQTVDLPAGLTVSIEMDTAVDSATAHIGDILRGHVTSDVRRKGKTIVPKGAIATGRVRGIERLRAPKSAVDLTIEIAELEWENSRAQFYGELLPSASSRDRENASLSLPSINGGVPDAVAVAHAGDAAETVHAPQIPGTGVLHLTGKQLRIAAGFRMDWRTWEPNQRVKKPK